jgi:hypothetical protein
MATDKSPNNNDRAAPSDRNDTPPAAAAPPNANELVKAQSAIIQLLADWPPQYQARTLHACAVTLGVSLATDRGAQAPRPPAAQNQRTGTTSNNNGRPRG